MCIMVVSQRLLGILVSSLACFLGCSLTFSLSLHFFKWHFIICTFARLSICCCNKHAASHCCVARGVKELTNQAVMCWGTLVRLWQSDFLMRWGAAPSTTAFPHSPELSAAYKHDGAPGRRDSIPPQAVCAQLICKDWITDEIQWGFLAGEHKAWKKTSFFSVNSIGLCSSELSQRLRTTQKNNPYSLESFFLDPKPKKSEFAVNCWRLMPVRIS